MALKLDDRLSQPLAPPPAAPNVVATPTPGIGRPSDTFGDSSFQGFAAPNRRLALQSWAVPVDTASQIPGPGTYPSADQAAAIAQMTDPVARNYAITQAYSDLSNAMGTMMGKDNANWATFAAWASKQAGVSIRKDDMPLIEHALDAAVGPAKELEKLNGVLGRFGIHLPNVAKLILSSDAAMNHLADAMAKGNQRVFSEIGPEFSRFIDTFKGDTRYDSAKAQQYLSHFKLPQQQLLKDAFGAYAQAMFEKDPKKKAELMLLGNDKIGLDEQTALQPYITTALNSPDGVFRDVIKGAVNESISSLPWPTNDLAKRALSDSGVLDAMITPLVNELDGVFRHAATESMMKLGLPGETLWLGNDMTPMPGQSGYPPELQNLSNADLKALVGSIDHHPGTMTGSGAEDWTSLQQRMQFIGDLFRSRQQEPSLFDPALGHSGSYPVS